MGLNSCDPAARRRSESKYVWPEEPAAKGRLPPAKPCVLGGNTGKRCTNSCKEVFTGGQQKKWASTPATPPLAGGVKASMFGRRSRPQRAGYLRRSRASLEVILGRDAPTPVRKSSPEDSKRSQRQLRRPNRSPEQQVKSSAYRLQRTSTI